MRNSVVEHRSAESEGLGFRTLWGLRYFLCLTIATRQITSLSIYTSLLVRLLQTAQGSLLDDEQLVNTLNSSKTTSQEVAEQLQVSEQTEIKIDAAREVLILFTLRYKRISLFPKRVFSSYDHFFKLNLVCYSSAGLPSVRAASLNSLLCSE